MRYIIYGAGGIGSIMGGLLARSGQGIILIGRPGHVNAIKERGLHLVTPLGTNILKIPAVTGPEQVSFRPDDVVCLCMKGQDTEAALKELKKFAAAVPVFCFQNGVRNEETAAQYFPDVYGVMVRVGATYMTDGEVISRRDPPGFYIIGRYPAGVDSFVEAVTADMRAAGYLVKATDDVMPYKWGKLISNLGNAIDAVTGAIQRPPGAVQRAVSEEALAILAKAGIRWVPQEQVRKDWPEAEVVRGETDTVVHSSTWQSLTRRQGSVETEFFNGEIVRVARKLGLEAPLNQKLVEITKAMAASRELPGKYDIARLGEIMDLAEKA